MQQCEKREVEASFIPSLGPLSNQSISQSVNQSVSQSFGWSFSRSVRQVVGWSVGRSVGRSVLLSGVESKDLPIISSDALMKSIRNGMQKSPSYHQVSHRCSSVQSHNSHHSRSLLKHPHPQ